MVILRKAKWVLYWAKILSFYLLGRLVRMVPRENKSIVLMGDVNYTGGTFVYFVNLIDLLGSEGFSVSILIPRRCYAKPIASIARQKSAKLFVIPDRYPFYEYLAALWRVCVLRAARVIVSASGPGTHTMAILWSIPTIHILHSVTGLSLGARSRRLIEWFFREPHRMVGVSRMTRDSIIRYFTIPRERQHLVSLIYNGVPDFRRDSEREAADQDTIVTVGHVVDYKNPSTWLRTARYVISRAKKKTTFIWAGDGPELAHYRSEAEGCEQISFIGHSNDVASLLRGARVYYQPSHMESFGLVVAQAMSIGMPCVVSDRGGLPELVMDGKNGFVFKSDDFIAHGNAIIRLLENEKLRAAMSRQSRRLYLEKFTLTRWRREILSVIAGNARRSPPLRAKGATS